MTDQPCTSAPAYPVLHATPVQCASLPGACVPGSFTPEQCMDARICEAHCRAVIQPIPFPANPWRAGLGADHGCCVTPVQGVDLSLRCGGVRSAIPPIEGSPLNTSAAVTASRAPSLMVAASAFAGPYASALAFVGQQPADEVSL